MKGGYKVGYGKPPQAAQFPKGTSGNPSGGKRGPRKSPIEKTFEKKVKIRIGGKLRSVTAAEAITMGVVQRALEGGPEAALVLKLIHDIEKSRPQPPPRLLSEALEARIKNAVEMVRKYERLAGDMKRYLLWGENNELADWAIEAAKQRPEWKAIHEYKIRPG